METQVASQPTTLSAIERALAAAKARKAVRDSSESDESSLDRDTQKQQLASDREQRKAKKLEQLQRLQQEKEERKLAKAAAKEQRLLKKQPRRSDKPAHMKKVENARARLAPLESSAQFFYNDITTSLNTLQMETLAQHLLVAAREQRTLAAANAPAIPVGATVRITGGEPKFIGLLGEVTHSQKLRLVVKVQDVKKPVYIYAGEAELATQTSQVAAE